MAFPNVHGYLFIYKAILHKLLPYSISPLYSSEMSDMTVIHRAGPKAQCSLMNPGSVLSRGAQRGAPESPGLRITRVIVIFLFTLNTQ